LIATVRSEAILASCRPCSSRSHATTVPDERPAATPVISRAANNQGVLSASRNRMAASAAQAMAISATGLRPIWSDDRPNKNSMLKVPAT
jgi:hypothetical protein